MPGGFAVLRNSVAGIASAGLSAVGTKAPFRGRRVDLTQQPVFDLGEVRQMRLARTSRHIRAGLRPQVESVAPFL
jgi:hypothetical protein